MLRRNFLMALLGAGAMALPQRAAGASGKQPRIVIVGGGVGGVAAALAIKQLLPAARITIVEQHSHYFASMFCNLALVNQIPAASLLFSYDVLQQQGIEFVFDVAVRIENKHVMTTQNRIAFDYAIVATGVGFDWTRLEGYDESLAAAFPHAVAGRAQFQHLHQQLHAMTDGDVFAIVPPPSPSRCTPAPYSRAGIVASWMRAHRPKSKVLILDSKEQFPMQVYFDDGWREYGERLEWWSSSAGGAAEALDAENKVLITEFGEETADVINLIPPQHAGAFAKQSGLADSSGWCPVHPLTMESQQLPRVYVVGDACHAAPMPKSATAAISQARVAAAAIYHAASDTTPPPQTLTNLCYNYIAPDDAFSESNTYDNSGQTFANTQTTFSAQDASAEARRQTAANSHTWYATTMRDLFLI